MTQQIDFIIGFIGQKIKIPLFCQTMEKTKLHYLYK